MGGRELLPHHFRVRAAFDHKKKKDRREWVRARLEADGAGGWQAVKFPREGAGILSSLVESDGLVELPEEMTYLEAGTLVDFLPFSEVSRREAALFRLAQDQDRRGRGRSRAAGRRSPRSRTCWTG